jgi:hypothetical protein
VLVEGVDDFVRWPSTAVDCFTTAVEGHRTGVTERRMSDKQYHWNERERQVARRVAWHWRRATLIVLGPRERLLPC